MQILLDDQPQIACWIAVHYLHLYQSSMNLSGYLSTRRLILGLQSVFDAVKIISDGYKTKDGIDQTNNTMIVWPNELRMF